MRSANMSDAFVSSRYNFHIPLLEGALLYNANSGAVLRFSDCDAQRLAAYLSSACNPFEKEMVPEAIFEQLLSGYFIIPTGKDEVATISERYHRARKDTPMVLTLTTTMDCNLGCYYCYEARSKSRLNLRDIDAITALVDERLENSGKRALHVDWYGGEPLLNIEFMEATATTLQELCAAKKATYSASIISNGTLWPAEIGDFINRHKVSQVQISFDGLRENHDKRRHYRKGYNNGDKSNSSFDAAVDLVDELLDHVRVDVRINIDRGNKDDVLPFIRFVRSRGWFQRRFPAVVQPAKLASYSEHSAFLRKHELTTCEYEKIRAAVRAECGSDARVEESESPNGFPVPRTSVCAALADDSIVIGADGREYRCGLQVSEPHRAVGQLSREEGYSNQPEGLDASWWKQFDPTTLPKCSRCSFLPICWSGCPKKHLEMDEAAIAEQSIYWRNNLARLVAAKAGVVVPDGFTFSETDQFRP